MTPREKIGRLYLAEAMGWFRKDPNPDNQQVWLYLFYAYLYG